MSVLVTVLLKTALICFSGHCYPVLVGDKTPTGIFQLRQRLTQQRGYDGDVLEFYENANQVFAIHRVWTQIPSQRRAERLKEDIFNRKKVTKGCINVTPEVYESLVDCCSNAALVIQN